MKRGKGKKNSKSLTWKKKGRDSVQSAKESSGIGKFLSSTEKGKKKKKGPLLLRQKIRGGGEGKVGGAP